MATHRAPATRLAPLALAFALLANAVPASAPPAALAGSPDVAHLIGQKLMVAMSGTAPSADLLGRVERGEVGGIILFGSNITTAPALAAATRALRQAAAAGGQPPLLIATDQEGGSVLRVPWAPPVLAPWQIGRTSTAFAQGQSTATVLGCAGIDTDLAPVADVPASTSSFMSQQGRTWSFSASATALLSDAFAQGIVAGLGVPVMKHFPGLGYATLNTDSHAVTITASQTALASGLLPYQTAISHGIPMVMLSNATYTAYDPANAAGWSRAISVGLLRTTLGFKGVSITDALTGVAGAMGVTPTSLAIRAAQAGTDMILLTDTEASTAATYAALVAAAQAGTIAPSDLQASYDRILALKTALVSPASDATPPTLSAPRSRLSASSVLGSGTVPVQTSWTASDPCAVSADGLQRQAGGGSFLAQALPSPRGTAVRQTLALATSYRYAAQAVDGAGNTGAWTYGATFTPRLIEQWSSALSYRGAWRTVANAYASGGSLAYSTAAGASVTYRFTGTSVAWVAYRGPGRGSAAIYLDGVYRGSVSLWASTYTARAIVYAASWGSAATHTIRIVDLGTAGHPRIDVDAFVRLTIP